MAAAYLQAQGLRVKARNYRQKIGEIDIICMDGDTYVFVEVKTRKNHGFGHPLEAVTSRKQRQICRAALFYLSAHDLQDVPVRFDVVGVTLTEPAPQITHVIAAFDAQ